MKTFKSLLFQCVVLFVSVSTNIQSNSPSRNVRPPLMGVQALKTKKQQHRRQSSKRSLRSK